MAGNVVFIDYEEGVKRMMNNAKFYLKLLVKFKDETKIDKLETALADGDLEKAYNEAHALKGVAANLSFPELIKQIVELESQIKAKSVNPGQVDTVKNTFAQTMQEVIKVIEQNG